MVSRKIFSVKKLLNFNLFMWLGSFLKKKEKKKNLLPYLGYVNIFFSIKFNF